MIDNSVTLCSKENNERNAFEQEMLFLSLSSASDVDLILEKKPMSLANFSRLLHLSSTLGFWDFSQELLKRFSNMIPNYLENEENQTKEEMEHMKQWESDFLNHLPSQEMRPYISKLFFK